MGLDCSHDAFSGAYSAFNRFRQAVAEATGGSYPPHWKYGPRGEILRTDPTKEFSPAVMKDHNPDDHWYVGRGFSDKTHPGLWEFLIHSDCDGSIKPSLCKKLADELEALLPAIEALNWQDGGHIARDGGYVAVTKRFIAGCRLAHSKRQSLLFR